MTPHLLSLFWFTSGHAVQRASRKRLHEDLTSLTFNFQGDARTPAPPTWLVTVGPRQDYVLRVGTWDWWMLVTGFRVLSIELGFLGPSIPLSAFVR